jgi:hypothetical protein
LKGLVPAGTGSFGGSNASSSLSAVIEAPPPISNYFDRYGISMTSK